MPRRRRGRRFDGVLALAFMAALAAWVLGPRAWRVVSLHAVALAASGAGALAVGAAVVAGRVGWRRWCAASGQRRAVAALAAGEPCTLSPAEFEAALAGLCRHDGCTGVRVVGGAGDQGADVLALAPDGRLIVVQAKRYRASRAVGSADVQRFGGTAFVVRRGGRGGDHDRAPVHRGGPVLRAGGGYPPDGRRGPGRVAGRFGTAAVGVSCSNSGELTKSGRELE